MSQPNRSIIAKCRVRLGGRLYRPNAEVPEAVLEQHAEAAERLLEAGSLGVPQHHDDDDATGGADAPAGQQDSASGQPNGADSSRGNTDPLPGYRGHEIVDAQLDNLPEGLDRALVEAVIKLEVENDDHWTNDGKPDANALSQTLGRQVKAAERDQLLGDLGAWLQPADAE